MIRWCTVDLLILKHILMAWQGWPMTADEVLAQQKIETAEYFGRRVHALSCLPCVDGVVRPL